MKWFKKIGAEAIITGFFFPILLTLIAWFASFVITSYNSFAEIESQKNNIQEIKEDVKFIRNYLLEQKNGR